MNAQNFSRRSFLKTGTALAAASIITPQHVFGVKSNGNLCDPSSPEDIFQKFQCPQWFKDAKFGLWLHWGPQTVPEGGGGWYSRHMYAHDDDLKEKWNTFTWEFHREHYGHQSQFGFKDICNLWKAEKFDADATIRQFKKWGARYAAIIAQHCDNFDLFNSSVHGWNAINVGPKRDILGEFATAARKQGLKWVATSHGNPWDNWWYEAAYSHDKEGPLKDVPYDGVLTKADGKGKWWEGLDPQQLYACRYPDYAKEFRQRMIELVENYNPDMLYFDWDSIPEPTLDACKLLYQNSLKKHGSIQNIITTKKNQTGTVLDFEKGIADGMKDEYWQTDTSLNGAWFHKPLEADADGKTIPGQLNHNARSLKELFVDIISKRGVLLLNLPVRADGSIPEDQFEIMEEFGNWVTGHSEAIFATEPWKIYGAGGVASGGHFNERMANSEPWDDKVYRFTRSKDKKTLYIHIFGNTQGKKLIFPELANKDLFTGKIKNVSLMGANGKTSKMDFRLTPEGLTVTMTDLLPYKDCNVLKLNTSGL